VKYITYILVSLLALMLTACNGVVENKSIPAAGVSFRIDVSSTGTDSRLMDGNTCDPQLYDKEHPAVMSYGNGQYGYSGVVVVRGVDNVLYAFDRCCPYEAKREIKLNLDYYYLTCPACGSQFSIGNGSGYVNKGPAVEPLKTYHVYKNGTDIYRVTN